MDVAKQSPPREAGHYSLPPVDLGPAADWFRAGNFCGAAGDQGIAGWRQAAALGLVGRMDLALDALEHEADPEARFYFAASLWMAKREDEAKEVLRESDLPEAAELLRLISKERIEVVAQTVWEDKDFSDDKFSLQRIGLKRTRRDEHGDIVMDCRPVKPFLSARDAIQGTPDFYFAHMIEWQFLPDDLGDLPCPSFGTTSDLDLHIQNNAPILPAFDEVITVGSEEWAKARALRPGAVCTFPKLFGIDLKCLPILEENCVRDVDLFISGTMRSPYHPDKARLLQQWIKDDSAQIRRIDGFLAPAEYYAEMARAKASFTYVRHPGSMPSRGIESLAMGCAVLTQEESALRLFAGENEGVVAYHTERDDLMENLQKITGDWETYRAAAQRGRKMVRTQFSQSLCISQFLRFLTVRAAIAKERGGRDGRAESQPHQKRVITSRGWMYPPPVNYAHLKHNLERAKAQHGKTEHAGPAINAARELDLYLTADMPDLVDRSERLDMVEAFEREDELLHKVAKDIYKDGWEQHPHSLVLRFNALRHAFHLGDPAGVEKALAVTRELLAQPADHWRVFAEEDVMPWDYHSTCFDYRSYFDTLTEALGNDAVKSEPLANLIRASLAHYLGQYTGEVAPLEQAVEWNPDFPYYRYALARALLHRREPGDAARAVVLLDQLARRSIILEPAFLLLVKCNELLGEPVPGLDELESRYKRFQKGSVCSSYSSSEYDKVDLVKRPGQEALPLAADPFAEEAAETVSVDSERAAHLVRPTGARPKQKILLVGFECGNWQNAKAWSYNGFYALEEGLAANEVEFKTLPALAGVPSDHPASWLGQAQYMFLHEEFDQAWIWITHNDYDPDFLDWIKSKTDVRVGVIMESLEHTPEEEQQHGNLAGRREKVKGQLQHCTHALTFDDRDAETLAEELGIPTMWCPPVVTWREVCDAVALPEPGPAAFQGTIYNLERKALLESAINEGLLTQPPLPEIGSGFPRQFDVLQINSLNRVSLYDVAEPAWLGEYLVNLRRLRRRLNDLWMEGLQQSYAQVNLPSIFKCYAGRVVETMAAGRPVISWDPPRARTRALFAPGQEIELFKREDAYGLAQAILKLQKNPEAAARIAERARAKVLRHHTAEVRMRQVLDWLARGDQPDYGEGDFTSETNLNQTDESITPDSTMNDTNETPQLPEGTLEEWLDKAEQCHEQNDVTGAITALKQALELSDRHPMLLRALGAKQFAADQFAEARTNFAALAELCPDDVVAHLQLGLAAFHADDREAFEACLVTALDLEPENREAMQLLGDYTFLTGDHVSAKKIYSRIATDGGVTPGLLHALAVCQFKTGNTDQAADTYRQLLEFDSEDQLARENLQVIEQGETIVTPAVEAAPEVVPQKPTPNNAAEQADFFLDAGNPEAAIAELEQAVLAEPDNPLLIDALGSQLFQLERFEEARLKFRKLIELQPGNAAAYTRLAMAAEATDRTDEFESALGLAMEIDPDNPEMLRYLGKLNLEQERYYDAGVAFTQLATLEPDNPDNLLAMGVCLFRGGQIEIARETFERVLQLDPDNALALTNLEQLDNEPATETVTETESSVSPYDALASVESDVERILIHAHQTLETGDVEGTRLALEEGLVSHPDDLVLLNAIGNLFFREKRYAEAAEIYHRLTEITPDDAAPHSQAATSALFDGNVHLFNEHVSRLLEIDPENSTGLKLLATAKFRIGEFPEAAKLYARVLEANPEEVESTLALGMCFHKLKDNALAVSCFRRALEIDPYNATAASNLKALAEPTDESAEPETPSQNNGTVKAETVQQLQRETVSNENDGDLPPAALVGSLVASQDLLNQGEHLEAWNAALDCLARRPFHPEAWLHLAEIALDAGDEARALQCLDRLLALSPKWDVPVGVQANLKQKPALTTTDIAWPEPPAASETPRLSVCMIVKDEEEFILQAIKSVKDLAHQVVVVDTGSTDRTVALAESLGAEVHHFEWNENFSDARNYSLEHVTGDWVLILDADEILDPEGNDDLARDLYSENQLGFRIPLANFMRAEDQTLQQTGDGVTYVPRLFRNAPGLHFVGRVHEQIFSSIIVRQGHWGMDSGIGRTRLLHFGYDPSVKLSRDKVKRNLRLLDKAVEEMPDEPALLMNYALDLFNDGRIEEALTQNRHAMEVLSQHEPQHVMPEVRERLVSMFCFHLLQAEKYDELLEVAHSQLSKDCGPTASIHYVAALGLIKQGRHAEAIPELHACIEKSEEQTFTPRFRGVEAHGPYHLLADSLAETGDADGATEAFQKALEISPDAAGVRHGLGTFLVKNDRAEEAVQLLFAAIEKDVMTPTLWSLGCNIVNGHLNDTEIALHWTDCAAQDHPEHPEISKQRGIALLTAGQFENALPLFEGLPKHPANEAARLLCRFVLGQPARLTDADHEKAVSLALVEWTRRLLERGHEAPIQKLTENLKTLTATLPTAGQVLSEAALVS
ncbi:MAG: tetratricopeptide repeat protein [Verrucomicrobia subdivision 3 bacterium]|nr:tetratricopeptide repeat protein [Limisphaerales bacterium]